MKKLLITIAILMLSISSVQSASKLNSNAKYLKLTYKTDYENTIRAGAVREWEGNHSMIVYEINKQSDALMYMARAKVNNHSEIFVKAIHEWSWDGEAMNNYDIISATKSGSWSKLFIKLKVNWSMVKYEYKKQLEASSAY